MLATLRRSTFASALACFAWVGTVHAAPLIRITEVMSSSGVATPDWFEITNYGTAAADLTGWKMDDNSFSSASSFELFRFTTGTMGNPWGDTFLLTPGESAVFVETAAGATLPNFQTVWNLGSGTSNVGNPKLGFYSGSGISFSSSGDGTVVFDSTGTEVARVSFPAATSGRSFYWAYDASGTLATSASGVVSSIGADGAYASSPSGADVASPGVATVAGPANTRYWSANGTTLGGTGAWTAGGGNWSPNPSPVTGGTWSNGATAVFTGGAGTVTVNTAAAPLGLSFLADGVTLAAGSGSITTSNASVAPGVTATIAARLTGTSSFGMLGGGTLVLAGTANDYTGATSVLEGTGRSGAANVIPDASRLTVARLATYDFAGFSDTVAGFSGLGTIRTDGSLTVNITDASDQRFDGFLSGTGDLIIDSAGTGRQVLNTTQQTLNDDFAVKDYSGATIVRRGTLAVNHTAQPINTSGVTIEAGGRLELTSDTQTYSFGSSPATIVTLAGGTLGQEPGEEVTLANAIDVTADSTIAVATSNTPDPLDPTIEFVRLTGPLSGSAGRTLSLAASNTTPGQDRARVDFASASGNTFAGTISAGVNMSARFEGDYSTASVTMGGGTVEGAGAVKAIAGTGWIAPGLPDGDLAPGTGILTAETVTPAGFSFQFEFQVANSDPYWSFADFSGNDILRLTGAAPFTGGGLSASNTVNLLLDVFTLSETDTFRGGFFTSADLTAAIAPATYSVFVRNDAVGITPDLTVAGVNYSSLANWNLANSTTLGPAISMVAVDALFDGFTTTSGYVMELSLGGTEPPPPEPQPPYAGGYVVHPLVGDNTDVPWGSTAAWQATGPTEGFSFGPPKAGDSIEVNKETDGRRNVDLGGAQAVGDIASTVNGNENQATNGGVRFRGGVLTLAPGDDSESLITYSGTGQGRLEFRFDGPGEGLVLANDVRVEADNIAGRVDIRGTVSGTDTLTKAGPGELRFTATFDEGGANLFNATGLTGELVVEEGVLALGDGATLPSVASVTVEDGGQLRLAGAGTAPVSYSLGSGTVSLAGAGRSGVPADAGMGTLGALRYEPSVAGEAVLSNAVTLTADAGIHVAGGNALTLAGAVSGTGGLTKSGGGELVLAATNTYSGSTSVATGSLTVLGTTGTGTITVESGAAVGGTGSIAGTLVLKPGSRLRPGMASAATQTAGLGLSASSFGGESLLSFDGDQATRSASALSSSVEGTNDGSLALGGGGLGGSSFGSFGGGMSLVSTGDGSSLSIAAVPEPASGALAVLGVCAAAWALRRRRVRTS